MEDSVDRRIQALANRQRGYLKRAQLLALGLGRQTINRWIATGRLVPIHAGVYAVGHIPRLPEDRAYGALLACGARAVLSHGSAATLFGIYRRWDVPFEVTTPTKRARRGIRTHRAALTREDTAMREGLRVTSPARTFLDIAPRLSDRQLKYAFNRLRLDHALRTDQLGDVLERFPGHPGAGRIKPLAGIRRGPTRSHLERKFDALCKRYGLPEPLLNHKINGVELDAFFPEHGLIVEIDGYDVHAGPASFELDRDRDASMLALGHPTVRITEERMDNAPDVEAARFRRILANRRAA
ncbi:MAG TPA: type IV toxin-antitoxin system AbiEi family antitoxin domain-containing protein [Solirubrobacteraceae bacterium]